MTKDVIYVALNEQTGEVHNWGDKAYLDDWWQQQGPSLGVVAFLPIKKEALKRIVAHLEKEQ